MDVQSGSNLSEEILGVHRDAVVIDALTTSRLTSAQAERMRQGGVTATNHTSAYFAHDLDDALVDIVQVRRTIEQQAGDYRLVTSASDIEAAKSAGQLAIILGLQNAKPVEDKLEYLTVLDSLGVRIVQLTYNERNLIGDGCTEPANAGLSEFGRKAVREMNRLGILIDLSHCGYQTTREAIVVSDQPVAITHSNPLELSPSPRNKPNDILEALANNGGVLGVCAWSPMTHRGKGKRPNLSDLLDIIDYAVELMGIDHVGIGTDHGEGVYQKEEWEGKWGREGLYPEVTGSLGDWYGFESRYVEGLHSAALFPNLTAGLVERGYAPSDTRKILGGNFLRLFQQVWDS